MEWLTDPETYVALLTLTALEIILGIDNIIFITILAEKLPESDQDRGRTIGLAMAMISRILLLLSVAWLTRLTQPWFQVFGQEISGRDIILMVGGLFLLAKSTFEIHDKLEGEEGKASAKVKASFFNVVFQIMLLDLVFSVDSVITAVGMANRIEVMVIAVILAVLVMMFASRPIGDFVNQRPTLKILALSFLLLIGVSLVAEGLEFHIPKGYIYFAMSFSVFVEILNLRLLEQRAEPLKLRQPYAEEKTKE